MESARRALRWVLRHGIFRRMVERRLQAGDLTSRLLLDPRLAADPYPSYDELRARGRLFDNAMVLNTGHHDVALAVLRSPDFGVGEGQGDGAAPAPAPLRLASRLAGKGPLGPAEPPSMLTVDPPDHTRYRKLVTRAFSARKVAALRTRTEEIATGLLDAMAAKGPSADLVADYAALLPATVIAEMLGAPAAMRGQFLAWGEGAALSLDAGLSYREFVRSEKDVAALQDWMRGHFAALRREPDDTILSALLSAHDDDGKLSEDELLSIAMLLLAAGFETTVNLIGNGAALLTAHRDQLAVLRAEPERWPNAVEEVLRIDSPVQRTGRFAVRDTEVAGERVPAGRFVITMLGAANRDPAVFTDPDRFDVTRANAGEHLAFSSGAHYCLGAVLARMEGQVALRALFERFPDLTPDGPPHRRPTRTLRGWDAMPVTLQPTTVDA